MGFAGDSLVVFAIAVAVTVMVCTMLRMRAAYRLATVTVAIVMLINSTAPAWRIALNRSAEVALGIVVAVALHSIVEVVTRTRAVVPFADPYIRGSKIKGHESRTGDICDATESTARSGRLHAGRARDDCGLVGSCRERARTWRTTAAAGRDGARAVGGSRSDRPSA